MVLRLAAFFFLTGSSLCGEEWWAFQPLEKPRLRQVDEVEAIDALVKAGLATQDLQPARPADPGTLIRRLHFDLTGLPPSF